MVSAGLRDVSAASVELEDEEALGCVEEVDEVELRSWLLATVESVLERDASVADELRLESVELSEPAPLTEPLALPLSEPLVDDVSVEDEDVLLLLLLTVVFELVLELGVAELASWPLPVAEPVPLNEPLADVDEALFWVL